MKTMREVKYHNLTFREWTEFFNGELWTMDYKFPVDMELFKQDWKEGKDARGVASEYANNVIHAMFRIEEEF